MRSKNALNNLIAALSLSVITAISGLILPKLFIMTYGSEINGLISSIKQFLVYLALVEAGIGYASMAILYSPLKEKNYKAVNSILSATKTHYIKSGWIFLGLVLLLAVGYPYVVANQIPWNLSFFMVLALGISGVAEFFLIGKYNVLLTAAQKGYIVSYIQTGGLLLNIAASVILILLETNPVLVQLIASCLFVLRFVFLKMYIAKNFKKINYGEVPDNNALNKKWDVLIHQIVSLVLANTPIIMITVFLGLKEVSVFSVYLLVHNMVIMLLAVFMNGFQAIFGDIISERNKELLKANFHLYESLFYPLVSITYVVVAILFLPFQSLYTQGFTDADYIRPEFAVLFVLIGVLHNVRVPSMSIMNAAGLYRETRLSAIVEAVVGFVLSLIFVHVWGATGVLLAWLLAYSYRILILIKQISKDYIYGSMNPTLKTIAFNTVFGVLTYILCTNVIDSNITNYIDFILTGFLCTLMAAMSILLLNRLVYRQEYKMIKSKVMGVVIKRMPADQ
ncbi:lipopolysaccharide biosynthesis protein [Bacillus sp. T33-2]|uniref:lipopolysaccharide biosynthesis protein n=1 Tax=Bacillus sp. T33-2 TaxID=2054168 RepID=UPI000C77BECD|nr:polysaccharide biosynthesis C-terminal domain-containing protein [Bacillus sp. T33-2]PLR91237.1 polysaccharide transport protein [Bacillus sp. T33-2]